MQIEFMKLTPGHINNFVLLSLLIFCLLCGDMIKLYTDSITYLDVLTCLTKNNNILWAFCHKSCWLKASYPGFSRIVFSTLFSSHHYLIRVILYLGQVHPLQLLGLRLSVIGDDVLVAVLVVELCSRVFWCIFKSEGTFIWATFPFPQMVCWVRYSSATRSVSESSLFWRLQG